MRKKKVQQLFQIYHYIKLHKTISESISVVTYSLPICSFILCLYCTIIFFIVTFLIFFFFYFWGILHISEKGNPSLLRENENLTQEKIDLSISCVRIYITYLLHDLVIQDSLYTKRLLPLFKLRIFFLTVARINKFKACKNPLNIYVQVVTSMMMLLHSYCYGGSDFY